jgi:hypothetical protein
MGKRVGPEVVTMRGCDGLWQLESQCGLCGSGAHIGPAVAVRIDAMVTKAMNSRPLCDSGYQGRPRNKCRWPLSYAWVFVPYHSEDMA